MVQGYCREEAVEWALNYVDLTNLIGVPRSRFILSCSFPHVAIDVHYV
jgi:hypothetical protein